VPRTDSDSVATHFVRRSQLTSLMSDITGADERDLPAVLARYHESAENPTYLDRHAADIERCFSKNSVEDIVAALKSENTEWANEQLKTMSKASPTAMKVVFEQLRRARTMTLLDVFHMDYRISQAFMVKKKDFFEGVRAQLVDKDKNPKWDPPTLQQVNDVEDYFKPLPAGEEFQVSSKTASL